MNHFIPILCLTALLPLLNCCVGQRDDKLWFRHLSEEERIPVLTKTTGELAFQESKDSVVATIKCPDWPWYEFKVNWPVGAPRIAHADLEVMEEKWMGGGRLVGRVISNGKTLYDASICEKHQVPMVRRNMRYADGGEYPIRQGTSSPALYPNAGIEFLYGCNSGLTPSVWSCPVCYDGFERWTKRLGISE